MEKNLDKLPRSASLQIQKLPKEEKLVEVTQNLYLQLKQTFKENKIDIISARAVTLTDLELLGKLGQISWNSLVTDIHKINLVLKPKDINPAVETIFNQWPSPKLYWWGLPALLHPSDPNLKSKYRGYNLDLNSTYLSIKIAEGAKLAQVQLTPIQELK